MHLKKSSIISKALLILLTYTIDYGEKMREMSISFCTVLWMRAHCTRLSCVSACDRSRGHWCRNHVGFRNVLQYSTQDCRPHTNFEFRAQLMYAFCCTFARLSCPFPSFIGTYLHGLREDYFGLTREHSQVSPPDRDAK